MKNILPLLLMAVSLVGYGQGLNEGPTISGEAMQELYSHYKQEYALYEKKHGHFIQTANARMHFLTWGDPAGIPLIWSHGTYGNAFENCEVADSLAASGIYLIAIDYYGHGLTPFPQKAVSLYNVADDIMCLMDTLKIQRTLIGGFSRGGSIATAFYDAYPDKVAALVLEDGGSVAWDVNEHKLEPDSLIRKYNASYKARQPKTTYSSEFELFSRLYKRQGANAGFRRIVFTFFCCLKQNTDGRFELNPGVEDFVCERTAEQLTKAILCPHAASSLFGASTHLLSPQIIYRHLRVPMLVFDPIGDPDWFDFEEQNDQLQEQHPGLITHKIYRQTGHGVKFEHPSEFAGDMIRFILQGRADKRY